MGKGQVVKIAHVVQHIKDAEGAALVADDHHGITDHVIHVDGSILFDDLIQVGAQAVDIFGKGLLERLKLFAGLQLFKM